MENKLAFFYLGISGFIVRSNNQAVVIDPADMLESDEIQAAKNVNLIVLTHDHSDHFSAGKTQTIFKATVAPILAEPKVASKLKEIIPTDKLASAESGKTYTLNGVTATAIEGIHRGPIVLFQITIGGITLFHGGDSGYIDLKGYPSQVAMVPVGEMSPTASPEDAFKMVSDIKPSTAIAMHGSDKQKQQFKQKVEESIPQTEVIIMQPYSTKVISVPNP
jgi:L-ascorbate metabolism protein UlaG (beta-lactamase superfamily)